MLDTIILQIPIDYSAIIDHSQFIPPTRGILNNPNGFCKYVNNPTSKDKEMGIYKPRLTIIKRGNAIYLKIEFSAPKIIFGNNLDEVEETDFNEIVGKLQKTIKDMGVLLWTVSIERANVIAFHPSKNIPLSKGYTSSFVIGELSKISFNQKLDLEKIGFRNNGEALQFYSNRHSVVLYDKINDLNKPAKRAIDKDQINTQLELFESIKRNKRRPEVLRFEIRLSHKDKMKEILEKVKFIESPIFKNIFNKDLCQKIVNLYWDTLFKNNAFLFNINNNPQGILQTILARYPKTKIKTAILLTGLNLLCRDDDGIKGFRNIISNYSPKTSWMMLKDYLKKFEDDIFSKPTHGFIKDIQRSLNSFNKIKIN